MVIHEGKEKTEGNLCVKVTLHARTCTLGDYTYCIFDRQAYTCLAWSLCQSLLYFQGVILSVVPFCCTVSEHCFNRIFVIRHQTSYSNKNMGTVWRKVFRWVGRYKSGQNQHGCQRYRIARMVQQAKSLALVKTGRLMFLLLWKRHDITCQCVYFMHISVTFCKVSARWVPLYLTDEHSTGGLMSSQKHFLSSIWISVRNVWTSKGIGLKLILKILSFFSVTKSKLPLTFWFPHVLYTVWVYLDCINPGIIITFFT